MTNRTHTHIVELEKAVEAEFFYVGGVVRDEFLGIKSKDIDILSRNVPFDELVSRLRAHGRVKVTGQLFPVIRYYPNDMTLDPLEIALPRTEVSTGVGHKDFKVLVDHNLSVEEDMVRRDFTCNAIAKKVTTGEITDPLNGRLAIEDRVLHATHIASAKEDPLRIIRAIRFLSKLEGFKVTDDTERALVDAAPLIPTLAGERIQEELVKMVCEPYADKALRFAHDIGALKEFLPEIDAMVGVEQNQYHAFDVFEHTIRVLVNTPSDDAYVKLAALFHDVGKVPTRWVGEDGIAHFYKKRDDEPYLEAPAIEGNHEIVGADIAWDIMSRMKFSNEHKARVSLLVRLHMFPQENEDQTPFGPKAARRFLSKLANSPGGVLANTEALFDIREGDCRGGKPSTDTEEQVAKNRRFEKIVLAELDREAAFTVKDLALDGHDFMNLGYRGRAIGNVQKRLLDKVIDEPKLNTKEKLVWETLFESNLKLPAEDRPTEPMSDEMKELISYVSGN